MYSFRLIILQIINSCVYMDVIVSISEVHITNGTLTHTFPLLHVDAWLSAQFKWLSGHKNININLP